MRAAARLLLATLLFGAWGSCHGESEMTLFDQRWNEMKASPSGAVEAQRLDSLVEFAHSHGVKYTVSLADAATGKPVPIAALANDPPPAVRVHVAVDDKGKSPPLEWEPRDPANVTRLLRE